MIKRFALLLVLPLLFAALPAAAGPTAGGVASDDVEYVGFVPFEVGTATGANVFDKFMVVTSWKNFSIYDISKPEAPQLLATEPFGFRFENEDVATDGKIMLFSEQLPSDALHIYDIEDKTNPRLITSLPKAGGHTTSCVLGCKWAFSSDGDVTDLRKPTEPVLTEVNWKKAVGIQGGIHDVNEVRNGFIVTSPTGQDPIMLIDARNPLAPKVLAAAARPEGTPIVHSTEWPRGGKDKLLLAQTETNARPRCSESVGGFMTFSTAGWKKTHTFQLRKNFTQSNGTFTDGRPAVNGLGCSAHWFQSHPTFNNGGLVAVGWYEHGTRFLNISPSGEVEEVGYFMPYGGSTSAAYWVSKDLVYAIDYSRGFDVLRWKGKF